MRDEANPRLLALLAARGAAERAFKATGVDKTTLSRLKSGKTTSTSKENMRALADHFGVRLEWLLTGAEPRSTEGGSEERPAALTPADRARAAAVALGFHAESIERGLAKAEEDDTAWDLLTRMQSAESKRPVGDLYGSPTVKPFAKPDPTLKDKLPAPADAPPTKQKAAK